MAARNRTKAQAERDRIEVVHHYLEGKWQYEIAAIVGISQEMVSYDLKAVQKQWRDIPQAELTELKAKELAKIDHLEMTYWQAWHDSKKPTESTKQSKQVGSDSGTVEKRSQTKNGNPAYLQGVERCISARVRILGLDAPVRSEIAGADGSPIQAGLSQVTIDAIKSQILGIPISTASSSLALSTEVDG